MKKSLLPPFLYWVAPQVSIELTAEVTSALDINALVQSSPKFWIKADSSDLVPQPKILLLSDWSLKNNREHRVRVLECVNKLLLAGFSIKVLRAGKIETVYSAEFIPFDEIDPLPCDEIKKQLAEHGISTEQSCILDYVKTRQLCRTLLDFESEAQAAKTCLDLHDLYLMGLQREACLATLEQTHFDEIRLFGEPQLKGLDWSFSIEMLSRLGRDEEIKITVEDAFVSHQLGLKEESALLRKVNRLVLTGKNVSEINWSSAKPLIADNLEEIICSDHISNRYMMEVFSSLGELRQLKKIQCKSCIELPILERVYQSAPNLVSLDLSDYNSVYFTPECLGRLRRLFLGESLLFQVRGKFLNEARRLEVLKVPLVLKEQAALSLEKNSLLDLRELNLSGSRQMAAPELGLLLEASPALAVLNLTKCWITGPVSLASNCLPHLMDLTLYDGAITGESLSALLKAAPSLVSLDLGRCKIEGLEGLSRIRLRHLKDLDLHHGDVSDVQLVAFLKMTPALEALNLRGLEIKDLTGLVAGSLGNLKRLDLETMFLWEERREISSENLLRLLKAAPALEVLKLRGRNIKNLSGLAAGSLSNLKYLDLYNTKISHSDLQILLKAAPAIEALVLDYYQENDLAGLSLQRLKRVSLKSSKVDLVSLLEVSPVLEVLNWDGCEICGSLANLKPHPVLNNVKKIHLQQNSGRSTEEGVPSISLSAFTGDNIGLLLKALSNLEILKITGEITGSFGKDSLPKGSLCKVKQFSLINMEMTNQDLNRLLNAMPALEELVLSGFSSSRIFLEGITLPALKKIDVSGLQIDSDHFNLFLEANPSIQSLNISRCEGLNGEVMTQTLLNRSTPLTTLIFSKPPLSTGNVKALSQRFPDMVLTEIVPITYSNSYQPSIGGRLLSAVAMSSSEGEGPPLSRRAQRIFASMVKRAVNAAVASSVEAASNTAAASSVVALGAPAAEQSDVPVSEPPQDNTPQEAVQDVTQDDSAAQQQTDESVAPTPSEPSVETAKKIKQAFLKRGSSEEETKLDVFIKKIFDGASSQLIDCNNKQACWTLGYILHEQACHQNKPVFYVNSIEQLSFLNPRLRLNERNEAVKEAGRGGELYDFFFKLQAHERFLVLNLSGFTAQERIAINTLLDEPPTLDGIPLPVGTKIIGIDNIADQEAYRGPDFLSRFKAQRQLNSSLEDPLAGAYEASLNPLFNDGVLEREELVIELFHDAISWRRFLEGEWEVYEGLVFKRKQDLQDVLTGTQARMVVLRNPPLGDPAFDVFWQKLFLERKMDLYGQSLSISNSIQLQTEEGGYDWEKQLQGVMLSESVASDESVEIISQNQFALFFSQYCCVDGSRLGKKAGILESYQDKALTLVVSQSLSADQWSCLLMEVQRRNITLTIVLKASGCVLPDVLERVLNSKKIVSEMSAAASIHTDFFTVIHTQDVEAGVVALPKRQGKTSVMSLTNSLLVSDILPRMQASVAEDELGKTQLQARFMETEIWKRFCAGERVVLKGPVSEDLIQALLPLSTGYIWLNGEKIKINSFGGQLVLMTDDARVRELFPCVQEIENVLLPATPKALLALPVSAQTAFQTDWDYHAKQKTEKFNALRKKAVETVLENHPWVVLVGPTGVGKTAFVKSQYPRAYWGREKLKSWLENKKGGVLFLDEANLETKMDWLLLNDLRQQPPVVWFEGVQYPLTEKHKVIFACNPLSYGGERKLPDLFLQSVREEEVVVFEDLPLASLYQQNIAPVLEGLTHLRAAEKEKIATCFMAVYQKIIQTMPEAREYFTARQLQVMALLFVSQYHLQSDQGRKVNMAALAQYCAYQVAKSGLPVFLWEVFKSNFSYDESAFSAFQIKAKKEAFKVASSAYSFVLTTEHQAAFDLLCPLLRSRGQATVASPLPGLIYEGPSGIGKSHFVMWALAKMGYQKASLTDETSVSSSGKRYYHLPINTPYALKTKIILKAFHEGAVLLIDECNAQVTMEKLFNAVISGQDLEGRPAKKPGFLFVGTQNPISMAGRQSISNALANRCLHVIGEDYQKSSLIQILEVNFPTLEPAEREMLVDGFLKAQKSQASHREAIATLRELLEFARQRTGGALCWVSSAPEEPVSSESAVVTEEVPQGIEEDSFFDSLKQVLSASKSPVQAENFIAAVKEKVEGYRAIPYPANDDFSQFKREVWNLKKQPEFKILFQSKTVSEKIKEALRKIIIAVKIIFSHHPEQGFRETYRKNKRKDKAQGKFTFFGKKEKHSALREIVKETKRKTPPSKSS